MNPKIINLIILVLVLMMMLSAFNYFLSLFFSKIGLSVIFLIWFLYQLYKMRNSGGRRSNNNTYYDHINTYSPDGGFEYKRNSGDAPKGIITRVKEWFLERKRLYHYAKFKKNWDLIQKKYALDMRCPYCGSDLTVFNVTGDAKCSYCKNKLI